MACRLCQLPTEAALCQVCQYLTEIAPLTLSPACRYCHAPIAEPEKSRVLCQVCRDLLATARNSLWLASAHAEWDHENLVLAKRKQELL